MSNIFLKILKDKSNIININSKDLDQKELVVIGKKIKENINYLFNGSLAIRQIDAGSDNSCEQELVALTNNFYDIERFGIHFVASPRHADMLLITGPLTRNMSKALKDAYDATPNPKIVVTVGDDAFDGGIFNGSYAVLDKISNVIPVDYHIPGNPPSPKTILLHILNILETNKIK